MNKSLVILILVVLAGLAVVGGMWFIKKQPVTPITTATPTMPTTTTSPAVTPTGNIVEVTVTGSEFKFVSNKIEAKTGDTVRVLFKNAGSMPHDFVIDELDVATNQLNEGEEEEVEFVADKTGTFKYYCSVDGHRETGMEGILTVEP